MQEIHSPATCFSYNQVAFISLAFSKFAHSHLFFLLKVIHNIPHFFLNIFNLLHTALLPTLRLSVVPTLYPQSTQSASLKIIIVLYHWNHSLLLLNLVNRLCVSHQLLSVILYNSPQAPREPIRQGKTVTFQARYIIFPDKLYHIAEVVNPRSAARCWSVA